MAEPDILSSYRLEEMVPETNSPAKRMAVRAFRFLKARYALDALRSQEIKVSRFEDLNDPFELYGMHLGNREHRAKFREWKDWASQRQAILCFSRRWRNPLLWSHYGDRHRGVALEFKIDSDLVREIRYSPYRLHINIKRAFERGSFSKADAEMAALTKAAHWKYEEEVRVVFDLPKCRHRDGMLFEIVNATDTNCGNDIRAAVHII
jgi:hypothetical protein